MSVQQNPQIPIPDTPDLFIPQIPFKQLPFPWADLTDVPQPDAPQYYPDHAPNVVATLAGMHPTNQQGQTINTDGNHAALVSVVNGGGGGASAATIITDTRFESGQCDNGDVVSFGLGVTPIAIVRFCGSAIDQHTYSSTTGSNVRFYLRGDDTGTTVDLGTITWTDFSADGTPIVTPMIVDLTASVGIDTSGIFAGDSTVSVDVSTAFVDVVYSWSMLFRARS